jgi:S-(hydroxymethyl)glutathione dehydrogenase/alcohol dehydrogenase
MPDGTSRFSYKGEAALHYMGCSTFSNYTVLPEIALAKVREDAPFDKICYIGCGVTTGIGAVINTAKVEPGSNVVVFGLGGIGLNVIQGARHGRRGHDRRRRHEPVKEGMGREVRHDAFRQPERGLGDLVAHLVELTGGGADYTFECIGNTDVMRMALECCHKGWGESSSSALPALARKSRPARSSWSPAGLARHGLRRCKGRTDVPKIVDWYMDGKIDIDPMITHTMRWTTSTRAST